MIGALLLGCGGSLSALGLAALSAWLITRAWQMPPILYLSVAITAVRALGISRGLFRYLERLATHDLALRAMSAARSRIFVALASGRGAYAVSLGRGDILSRTGNDIDDVGNALIRGVLPVGIAAVTDIAAVGIMASVSWSAALVLAIALVVSGLVAPWFTARGARRIVTSGSAARERLADTVTSALWHADELTVARRRTAVLDDARRADRAIARAADRGIRWQAAGAAVTPFAVGVSVVAACLIGIDLAGSGVSPMTLGVLILLPLSAFESTVPLSEAGLQFEQSRQAATRLVALIDDSGTSELTATDVEEWPTRDDVAVDPRPVSLECRELRWGWTSETTRGPLDLTLAPGSRIAIVGPSGVGKTALLLTMSGLLAPQHGSVVVDGSTLDESVCFFADDAHVFATSVLENIRVARGDATDVDVGHALDAAGLGEWVAGLPDGLSTVLTGGAESLSGGQRRRLLLARALVHRAPIVLLDEPTEHLDASDTDVMLRQLLASDGQLFDASKTVVVVTHQLPAEHGADRVIELGEDQ